MIEAAPGSIVMEALILAYIRRYHCGRTADVLLIAIGKKFGPQEDWTEARVAEMLALFATGRATKKMRKA